MTERQTLTIDLFCARSGVEKTLPEAIEWLQGLLAEVPPEHRERSFFSVELDYGICDDPTELDVQVYYNREETEAEADARVAEAVRRREESVRAEMERARWNYERLKARLGE